MSNKLLEERGRDRRREDKVRLENIDSYLREQLKNPEFRRKYELERAKVTLAQRSWRREIDKVDEALPLSLQQILEFLKLPMEERRRILSEQAKKAAGIYEKFSRSEMKRIMRSKKEIAAGKTVSWEEFLKRIKKAKNKKIGSDLANVQIAKDRLNDPKSRFISGTKLRKALKREH